MEAYGADMSNVGAGGSVLAYAHSFETVESTMRLVREGKKPYLAQYLLNPSARASDTVLVGCLFVLIVVIRFSLAGAHHPRTRRFPCAFKRIFGTFSKHKRDSKMCENLWYSLWHTFSFLFGIYVLWREGLTPENPGWTRLLVKDFDVRWYWFPTRAEQELLGNRGWPLFPVSAIMKIYYLMELANWLSCILFLWIETIRDDFHALLLHHITTCLLIAFSYVSSFWRIGSIILITHDFADIILYSAKAVHYMRSPPLIVDGLFFLFVIGFFLSRLVFFPLFCLRPALDTASLQKWTSGSVSSHWHVPGGISLPGFLCVLQVLHIFWFGLIIKMIRRTFMGQKVSKAGDIRSDDEDNTKDNGKEHEGRPRTDSSSETSVATPSDHRMKLSSLPGVRATTEMKHRRPGRSQASSSSLPADS